MPTPFVNNNVIIKRGLALLRIDNFLEKKDVIDIEFETKQSLADCTKYSPKQFLKLINLIIKDAGDNGGLRVYFASRSALNQELSLIYAPTGAKVDGVYEDVGKYYIINDNGLIEKISMNEAKGYVENFRNEILPKLEKLVSPETQMIFYGMEFITTLKGVLDNPNTTVKSIRYYFAGYLKETEERPYPPVEDDIDVKFPQRLTLVLNLRGPKIVKELTGDDGGNSIFFAPLSDTTNVDTGNPCPPPDDKPCPGAKLLQ